MAFVASRNLRNASGGPATALAHGLPVVARDAGPLDGVAGRVLRV